MSLITIGLIFSVCVNLWLISSVYNAIKYVRDLEDDLNYALNERDKWFDEAKRLDRQYELDLEEEDDN